MMDNDKLNPSSTVLTGCKGLESDVIPKTETDSKEYDSGSSIPKAFIGHEGTPKTEMDTEESDTGSYTSSSSMDCEENKEMKNNDFDCKHYLSEDEYDIDNHPTCFCERVAKRRMSSTAKNPGRWFFNCAKKNFNTQCGYFQWCDQLYGDGDEDMIETDDEEDEYETEDEHEDEEMVSSEEKSELRFEVSTGSVPPDQLKELNLFPEYPDLAILVQEYKPDIGLDGSILSLAPAGLPPV